MPRIIEVVPYDMGWKDLFEQEKLGIATALGENVIAIHHVGSTAVPGIHAKPTIDLLVVVRELELVARCVAQMQALGYVSKGENGIPGRHYFQKLNGEKHTHHIHVFAPDHPDVQKMLVFRDYLIAHPEEAQAYSRLKEHLAEQYRHDPVGYTDSKDAFICEILRKAL